MKRKILKQFQFEETSHKYTLGAILFIIALHFIYLCLEAPFRVDDIASYVFCAHQGPFVSAFSYHDVNNHIFFNILCSLLDKFHLPPELVMILPSAISWILILVLVFSFTRTQFGFRAACYALLLSGLLQPSVSYAIQGRGYMMTALFLLTCFFSVFEYTYKEKRSIYLITFVFSASIALWTLMSALIVVLPLLLFLWIKSFPSNLRKILIATIALGALVILFYIPVVLLNGLDRVYNHLVQNKGFEYFFDILRPAVLETMDYLLGVPSKGFLIFILAIATTGLLVYLKKIPKSWILFNYYIAACTFLFLLIKTVYPPYRTFTYASFLVNIILAVLLAGSINIVSRAKITFYISLIVIATFSISPHLTNRYIPFKIDIYDAIAKSKELSSKQNGCILVDKKDVLYYYLALDRIKAGNSFLLINDWVKDTKPSFVVQYKPTFPKELNPKSYEFVENFYDCKIYRIKAIP